MTTPPCLLLFMRDFEPGGAQQALLNLAEGFQMAGITVRLVVWRANGPMRNNLAPEIALEVLECDTVWQAALKLRAVIRAWKPDAILSALLKPNLAAVMAARSAGGSVRVVVSEHSHIPSYIAGKNRLSRQVLKTAFYLMHRLADAVTSVSPAAAHAAEAVSHLPSGAVTAVYNPILTPHRLQHFSEPIPVEIEALTPFVLYVGRLIPSKDVATLMAAFTRAAIPNTRLVIAGDGPEKDGLTQLANTLGHAPNVVFTGHVANPWPYYRAASVLVLPSRHESFGNVLVEALACGTPVIAADCPVGPRDILQQGMYGTLVPMGDVQALAAALEKRLSTPLAPDEAERLRKRALDFTLERSVKGYWPVLFPGVPCPALSFTYRP